MVHYFETLYSIVSLVAHTTHVYICNFPFVVVSSISRQHCVEGFFFFFFASIIMNSDADIFIPDTAST